ncbi:MAG: hypothetical protein NC395_09875 [Prevotella sp.]|nr:hypothetical protein [Prevotella sp.]
MFSLWRLRAEKLWAEERRRKEDIMHTYSHYDEGMSAAVSAAVCAAMIGFGIYQFLHVRGLAKKAGKICFRPFKRGSAVLFLVCVFGGAALTLMFAAKVLADGGSFDPFDTTFTVLFAAAAAVWIPLSFGFYVTRGGILYADTGMGRGSHKKAESFTARELDGRIGIFPPSDMRNPLCSVDDTPENREALADFWRELPERKKNPYCGKILEILEDWKICFEDFNIDFSLPFHCQLSCLNEDIIQAEYGSYLVDIGWYPEADPRGKLCLQLIENYDWQRPLAEYYDTDFEELERHLRETAKRVEDFYS